MRRDDDLSSGLRSFPADDYVIIHSIEEDEVVAILYVFHGSENIEHFFIISAHLKEPVMSDSSAETDAPEPIILVFSDKQVRLSSELTARIWEEVRLGYAKDPGEFV